MNLILKCCNVALTTLALGTTYGAAASDAGETAPKLLSAFFGLDNRLPFFANALCLGASGKDGMPVVFPLTVDRETLDPEDFAVITRSGESSTPHCVTLRPSLDPGETRTVLLIGEFGNADGDPPAKVRIVDDLLSDQPDDAPVNFRGYETSVTPLAAGPSLVWAGTVPREIWSQSGRGSSCPANTQQVVRATWAGGVRLPGGDEPGDAERMHYRVTVTLADGSNGEIVPAALADLGDNDNNHYLCLDTTAPATAVAFPGGHLVDPNGDLNPDSEVTVADTRGSL